MRPITLFSIFKQVELNLSRPLIRDNLNQRQLLSNYESFAMRLCTYKKGFNLHNQTYNDPRQKKKLTHDKYDKNITRKT